MGSPPRVWKLIKHLAIQPARARPDKAEQGIWSPGGGAQLAEAGRGGYQMMGRAPWWQSTAFVRSPPPPHRALSLRTLETLCKMDNVTSPVLQMRKLRFGELNLAGRCQRQDERGQPA